MQIQLADHAQEFARAHQAALLLLSEEMAGVRRGIEDVAQQLPGPGGAAARLMTDRPGKMVRPLLTGLVHRALGGSGGEECTQAAALVEIIHLSTLLHDDVVDEAPLRRGAPSAAAAIGNAAAVLGGDALVVHAMTVAHRLGPQAVERALHALQQLVLGELIQLRNRGNVEVAAAEALHVCALKTGALMRLCAELGAITAGGPAAQVRELGEAFERLGVAFQITDDMLDLSGDARSLGKSVGADVKQGTISHPLALALERSPLHRSALRCAFRQGASEERLGRIVAHVVARTGALAEAQLGATRETTATTRVIEGLPPSRARTVLLAVCQGLTRRTH
ncbi:MAG: polyprenyl synthetase family protein [Myxococcota bacterium]